MESCRQSALPRQSTGTPLIGVSPLARTSESGKDIESADDYSHSDKTRYKRCVGNPITL